MNTRIPDIYVDFIVSTGNNCQPAMALDANGLRFFSSPFDFLISFSSINFMSSYLKNGFDSFFKEYKELSHSSQENTKEVRDIISNYTSVHDFPKAWDVDAYYPIFINKCRERFLRLLHFIKTAKTMAFISCRKDHEIPEIVEFCKTIKSLNSVSEAHYINVSRCGLKEDNLKILKPDPNIFLYDLRFYDDLYGNGAKSHNTWICSRSPRWKEILASVHLTDFNKTYK